MARTLIVELQLVVKDDEQAALIMEAVNNGLAETAIKDRVLYSSTSQATTSSKVDTNKTPKSTTELKPILSKPVEIQEKVVEKAPRNRGVFGRRMLDRTGGER